MIEKIVEKTEKLKIGPAREPEVDVTAVIDEEAYKRYLII